MGTVYHLAIDVALAGLVHPVGGAAQKGRATQKPAIVVRTVVTVEQATTVGDHHRDWSDVTGVAAAPLMMMTIPTKGVEVELPQPPWSPQRIPRALRPRLTHIPNIGITTGP
jgi:hypothetical protein